MKRIFSPHFLVMLVSVGLSFFALYCGRTDGQGASTCSLQANTSASGTVSNNGCSLLVRDTSSCQASRTAQGLSGYWLKFSCRVTLTKSGSNVIVAADSRPDHKSAYFGSSSACYEAISVSGRAANPNTLSAQSITMTVPYTPSVSVSAQALGTIGIAINAASIYNNAANPPDNIYNEVATFDKCEGHPTSTGVYHYHTEPTSISYQDYAFVGVLRDGYPVYGRKDMDGTTPSLDAQGGHTGVTVDSSGASVYHYHTNLQTSGASSAYFLSTGNYHGAIGTCTGC